MQGKFSNLRWSVTCWAVFIPINMLKSPSPAAPEWVSQNQKWKPFAERNKMHRHQGQAHRYHFCCSKVQPVHLVVKTSLLQVKGPTFVPHCYREMQPLEGRSAARAVSLTVSAQGVTSGSRGAALPLFTPRRRRCLGSSSQLAKLCPSVLGIHTEQSSLFLSNYSFEGLHNPKGRLMFRKKF